MVHTASPAPASQAFNRPRQHAYAMPQGAPTTGPGYVREPMMSRPQWAPAPAYGASHQFYGQATTAQAPSQAPMTAASSAWQATPAARPGMTNRTIALLSATILSLGALIVMLVLTLSGGGDDSDYTPSVSKTTTTSTAEKPEPSDSASCLEWCGH